MQEVYARCTERVRLALALAGAAAGAQAPVEPEHLLLGLLREGGGVAAQALQALGVDEERLRWAIESLHGRTAEPAPPRARTGWAGLLARWRASRRERQRPEALPAVGEERLSAATRETLRRALADVDRLDHHFIATEHVLLQLARDERGPAATALARLEAPPGAVREAVQAVLERARGQGMRI